MASSELLADYLVERRRLRSKVTFWRVVAFLAVVAAVLYGGWRVAGGGQPLSASEHIARVTIEGLITGDRDTLRLLQNVADSNAAGVILNIESPGGTTTGSEKIYEELRRLAAKKPTVAVVGNMAASGAYIAALGADRIYARGNSLVGSIGVLFQIPNVSKLLDTVGVKVEEVKSSPLKAAPNGLEPTSPEARAALASLVADSYDWFKTLVKERRSLNDQELAVVADGRVFTGRQSLPLKLVDALGGEREAIEWLEAEKKVQAKLPVREWRRQRSLENLGILGLTAGLADMFGFESLAGMLKKAEQTGEIRMLDGLLAIWQGDFVN
jgi:protease-4